MQVGRARELFDQGQAEILYEIVTRIDRGRIESAKIRAL
jgi:hypothetical protein